MTGQNVREMLYAAKVMLDTAPEPELKLAENPIIRPETVAPFTILQEGAGWRLRGAEIERIAAMTYFEFDATLLRFQKILASMGISDALEEAGVQVGDSVFIGDQELEWGD